LFCKPTNCLVTVAHCSDDELSEAHIIKMNCVLGMKDMFIDVNVKHVGWNKPSSWKPPGEQVEASRRDNTSSQIGYFLCRATP
jgi:hypothetical protein